ncbi:hypothetical protein F5883DRAFT_681977 [Diaporthe sp. PMI_573]|nr:hypothetical protein F5883DRAFT_681977 [Diaporthaceae sp. PMI_573]
MAESKTPKTSENLSTATTEKPLSTTAPGFEDRLRQNGVLRHDDPWLMPPSNLDQLAQRFHRNRTGSTAPSEGKYRIFRGLAAEASNKGEVSAAIERYLFKDNMDPAFIAEGYRAKLDKQWLDYPKNQGFNNGLLKPKPDYVEGYKRSMFPPTISDLGGAITLDNKATNFIALPHFAAEYKGRDSNLHTARVQAGYDGAAMLHGRSIALQHLGGTDVQKHAAAVTAVTDGTVWHTYAQYRDVDQQTGDKVYYQYPVDSGTLDTYKNFQKGYQFHFHQRF